MALISRNAIDFWIPFFSHFTQVQLFISSHNYDIAYRMHFKSFQSKLEHEYTDVYLLWGMRPQDMSSCNAKSSEKCYGSPVFDDTFNPSTKEAQSAMKVHV